MCAAQRSIPSRAGQPRVFGGFVGLSPEIDVVFYIHSNPAWWIDEA
jgi:hypothetical protein